MGTKIILFFITIILLGGCKKYPEDQSYPHLRTAKQRLTNTFFTDIAKNFITGIDYSGSLGNDYISFKRCGDFIGENSELFNFNGKWEFEDKKNNLRIYNETKSFSFRIIRLDNDFLSIENDSIKAKYH